MFFFYFSTENGNTVFPVPKIDIMCLEFFLLWNYTEDKTHDDYDSENDAVDAECCEVSFFDVVHQKLDDRKRYHEGCQGAESEDYEFCWGEVEAELEKSLPSRGAWIERMTV